MIKRDRTLCWLSFYCLIWAHKKKLPLLICWHGNFVSRQQGETFASCSCVLTQQTPAASRVLKYKWVLTWVVLQHWQLPWTALWGTLKGIFPVCSLKKHLTNCSAIQWTTAKPFQQGLDLNLGSGDGAREHSWALCLSLRVSGSSLYLLICYLRILYI